MNSSFRMLSLAAAILAVPGTALADTATSTDSTSNAPAATMATTICRPATDQDKTTNADAMNAKHAVIATIGNETMICMKLDRDAMAAVSAKAKKMPSASDASAAWYQALQTQLNIPRITL